MSDLIARLPPGEQLATIADQLESNRADRLHRARKSNGTLYDVAPRRAENVGNKGYLRLTIQMPNKSLKSVMAHRVVWASIFGDIPDGMQINHIDLDKTNNAPSNLELVSQSGNIRHSYANGRRKPWSDATEWRGKPRVDDQAQQEIRDERKRGATLKEISQRFGVSISHVHRICGKEGEG